MLQVDSDELKSSKDAFLIKQKNKLEIDDANMFVLRNEKLATKELIIGYKTANFNTYTIMCMDTTQAGGSKVSFTHESFQLYESSVFGIITTKNSEFLKINKNGLRAISLSYKEKRSIKDDAG